MLLKMPAWLPVYPIRARNISQTALPIWARCRSGCVRGRNGDGAKCITQRSWAASQHPHFFAWEGIARESKRRRTKSSLFPWCRRCGLDSRCRSQTAAHDSVHISGILIVENAHLVAYSSSPIDHVGDRELVRSTTRLADRFDDGEVALQRVEGVDRAIVVSSSPRRAVQSPEKSLLASTSSTDGVGRHWPRVQ